MKTKLITTAGISILTVIVICLFIFMIYEKDNEVDIHTIIKSKQILKTPYKSPGSPKPPIVPMKLFQTWHTKELPPKMQKTVETIQRNNPELEYFLFDDNDCINFIKRHFPEDVVDAYNTLLPGAYKADLWRYCVMYIHGGVYLDIKYQCVDGFKFIDIMDRKHFVLDTNQGYWKPGTHGIYNALIITKPGNPLLLKSIDHIVHNTRINYYGFSALYPTGPGLLGELYFGNIVENMSKIDDFDLVHANINKIAFIIYKNQLILQEYPEYRMEQYAKQKHKHYGELWKQRTIYTM